MKPLLLFSALKAHMPLIVTSLLAERALEFLHKYVLYDWEFMACMGLLVFFDTLTGFGAAWKLKKIYSKKMWGAAIKITAYGISLVVTHILSVSLVERLPIAAQAAGTDIAQYIDCSVYCFLMFTEALSINENLGKVGLAFLPKFLMKRLRDFDETGKIISDPMPTPMDGAQAVAQGSGIPIPESILPPVPTAQPLPQGAVNMDVAAPSWGKSPVNPSNPPQAQG